MEIDLSSLPLGDVPRFNDALGEFHNIRPDLRYVPWSEPTNHWTWRGCNWRVGEEALATGQPAGGESPSSFRYLQQLKDSLYTNTILITDAIGRAVKSAGVEVDCPQASQEAGLVFAYRTALDYLALHLDRGGLSLSRRCGEHFEVLGQVLRSDLAGRWVALEVQKHGRNLLCLLDGQEAFRVLHPADIDGKIGLLANCPARFRSVHAEGLRPRQTPYRPSGYPRMQLARKIKTPGFGAARQIRFGDLTGDGQLDIVIAQRSYLPGSQWAALGAMTALTNRGEIIWQVGQPSEESRLQSRYSAIGDLAPALASDLPFQINDIDGDGRNELVCVRGFEIEVYEGSSGKLKYSAPVPERPPANELRGVALSFFGTSAGLEYDKAVINCLRFADLAGRGSARDVLIKDHHHNLWALSPELKPLWSFLGNLGHFPFAADINGDGREEVVAGYHLLSAEGKRLETLILGDHADAVWAGDVQGWGQPRVVRAGGDDGFLISGLSGDLLVIHHGHVQRLSVANFRREAPGLEYAICTYWGAPGIVAMIDGAGKLLWSRKYPIAGNTLQPTNWTGDGQELMFFSAHPQVGGLFNWKGEQVVRFPNDGHPDLCGEVVDVLGVGRDNLVAWDPSAIWIYVPRGELPAGRRYAPKRPPLHSFSNYMTYWSIPAWQGER